ncbi:MAG: DUF3786 domain-containing protein [Candidatus Helarchaeales archaeon]
MEDEFKSENYIRLEDFQGGRIWTASVESYKKRLIETIKEYEVSQEYLNEIFQLILAEVKEWKPYEDTAWVISIKPFPYFEILMIYNEEDEEEGFPAEIRIYYSKSSLRVPTEDTYVITELYLEFIEIFCKTNLVIIETDNLISLERFAEAHEDLEPEKVLWDVIGQRFAPVEVIDRDTARKVAPNINSEFIEEWKIESDVEWVIKKPLFLDLNIYYVKFIEDQKRKLRIYYNMSVIRYDARLISFFSWIFLNAIIREARLILGDKMPRISKYL